MYQRIQIIAFIVVTVFFSCSNEVEKTNALVDDKYQNNKELQEINKKIVVNPNVDSLYRQRAALYISLKDLELAEGDALHAAVGLQRGGRGDRAGADADSGNVLDLLLELISPLLATEEGDRRHAHHQVVHLASAQDIDRF